MRNIFVFGVGILPTKHRDIGYKKKILHKKGKSLQTGKNTTTVNKRCYKIMLVPLIYTNLNFYYTIIHLLLARFPMSVTHLTITSVLSDQNVSLESLTWMCFLQK